MSNILNNSIIRDDIIAKTLKNAECKRTTGVIKEYLFFIASVFQKIDKILKMDSYFETLTSSPKFSSSLLQTISIVKHPAYNSIMLKISAKIYFALSFSI